MFFVTEFQFTSDAYRMFAAIMRMSHSPVSWYGSSRSRDLILKHVKAMDHSLYKQKLDGQSPFSILDRKGQYIEKESMELALLMLCGHILYAGGSYMMALSKHSFCG